MEKIFNKTLKILLLVLVIFVVLTYTNKIYAANSTKQYTVTYSGRGRSNVPAKQTFEETVKTIKISTTKPNKAGCIFLGWSKSLLSNKVVYKGGETINNPKKNLNLYAVWYVNVTRVSLNKQSIELEEGKTFKLIKTISPLNASNKKVTFSSSNTRVAKVDSSGQVTAVKQGQATIIVTTQDGGKTAKCTVNVKPVTVKNVKLNKKIITLTEGKTGTLTATVYGSNLKKMANKKATFSSSNTGVAKVDSSSGKITAVTPGTATITAICDGKAATCKVTVKSAVVNVKSITLSSKTIALTEGGNKSLTAKVNPSNASNKTVTFKVTEGTDKITIKQNGNTITVTGNKAGTAVITATCGGKTAECKVTVNAVQSSGGGSSTGGNTTSGGGSSSNGVVKKYKEGSVSSKYYSEFKSNRKAWESNARYVYNRLIEAGATPAGAAGAIGNITQECRWNKNIYTKNITNSAGTFYGMVMWGGNRRINLQKRANYDTIPVQTDYMIYELTKIEQYAEVWQTLTTTNDVITASNKFQKKYEICGDATAQRQEFSIDWYNYFNGLTKY